MAERLQTAMAKLVNEVRYARAMILVEETPDEVFNTANRIAYEAGLPLKHVLESMLMEANATRARLAEEKRDK